MLDAVERSWWGGIEMAPRKTRPASPASPPMTPRSVGAAPSAAEVPATSGMLAHVRNELLEQMERNKVELKSEIEQVRSSVQQVNAELGARIDRVETGLRAEIHDVKAELRAEIQQVRAELGARIDRVETGLRAEIHDVKVELRAEIHEVKVELRAEIQQVRTELGVRIDRVESGLRDVKVGLAEVQASLHGMNARLERVAFLVEEQNARNKVALDAVMSMLSRQDRIEQRVDNVEDTVRRLAAA